MTWIASSGWKWGQTTICPSLSTPANFWRVSGASCDEPRITEHRTCQRNVCIFPTGRWTSAARNLLDKDGVVINLSQGEFRLLHLLAETPNCVFSRDQLAEALAGRDAGPFDRTIDVMISRIRRRLNDDARDPQLIKTIRSEGYMLVARVEQSS